MGKKVSDYIVDFLIEKGITDVFGYPGGMVTHLMESFSQKSDKIAAHVNYHEQGASFCACGYAQVTGKPGVAYATSGPGATNLITGICDAYFDSIPTVFLTGQVNTFEGKGSLGVRQKGFQETDIVSMVRPVTKYAAYVKEAEDIRWELEKAWFLANSGRKGPVLLDIPMNVQRSMVNEEDLSGYEPPASKKETIPWENIRVLCRNAERPVLILGAGAKDRAIKGSVHHFLEQLSVPVVTSMPAFDVVSSEKKYGFIGAYGDRTANFMVAKSDLIIALGTRLDVRQVGAKKENFAPDAKLIRVEIDPGELENKIKENEIQVLAGIDEFLAGFLEQKITFSSLKKWGEICYRIREKLSGYDEKKPQLLIRTISRKIPEDAVITTDVGQNQVWVAQAFLVKKGQQVLFSSGHGAMGYSLPAAIGAYYGSKKPVICFMGDGGFQMNMQELQFIVREHLPITVMVLNNQALGMIRHFQEMYFNANYVQTMQEGGYTTPDFEKLAWAYGIDYVKILSLEDAEQFVYEGEGPRFVEISLENPTYVFPKLEFGKPNQDQEPLLDRELYEYLMKL